MDINRIIGWLKNTVTSLPLRRTTVLEIILPASGAFIISFSLLILVIHSFNNGSKTEVLSPLAQINSANSTNVLAVSDITPSEPPMPTSTPSPSPSLPPTTPHPSATPKPLASPVSLEQLEAWFTQYANKESINRDQLKKIAFCESKFKPSAINGIYGGLYQFSSNTWISTRRSMNMNTDPALRFNAEEAIKTGAFRLATQGSAAWPNCK